MIQMFYKKYESFFKKFETKFVNYFTSLSLSYYKAFSKEEVEFVAHKIYKEIFDIDLAMGEEEENLFYEMRKEGIMVGFLLNRTLFYLLEHFIQVSRQKELYSSKDIEDFVVHITYFVKQFESNISHHEIVEQVHLNFDATTNIIFGSNIIETLKEMKQKNQEVMFFNLYKGVPISYAAKIIDIDGEEVVFQTTPIQEIAMKMDTHAYILKNSFFDKHIKADIAYNNFANNTVVLNNFTYLLNMPASQREYIRVHPDLLATVKIAQNKENSIETKGKLFDLSVNGVGVVSTSNNGLYAGAKIEVSFELIIANETHKITTIGEVLNIIEYSDSYRYCMKIFPNQLEEELVISYVGTREKEIIQNLKDLLSDYT